MFSIKFVNFFYSQPLNTLFMHLFVATDEYAVNCCQEVMK